MSYPGSEQSIHSVHQREDPIPSISALRQLEGVSCLKLSSIDPCLIDLLVLGSPSILSHGRPDVRHRIATRPVAPPDPMSIETRWETTARWTRVPWTVTVLEILIGFEEMQDPRMLQSTEDANFHSKLLQVFTFLLGDLPWLYVAFGGIRVFV